MNFKKHSDLVGEHAFLSASKYHWINYDADKILLAYDKHMAAKIGTALHELASHCIILKQHLAKNKKAINRFVNDAIDLRMRSEQVLYFSNNAFGTADAISFRDNILRIHDLKTGVSTVAMTQLEIYAALFCLEYDVVPEDIDIELRIYQHEDTEKYKPEAFTIRQIMEKIIAFDKMIEKRKSELED